MSAGPDVVVIGSGMGGATLAAALAASGRRIVILERGERLADGPEARDAEAIFGRGHFRPKEEWLTPAGEAFNPGNYYYVGGNTKLYGAVLIRYRAEDFRPIRHLGGTTPGWPIAYEDLEPWYQRAEEMYRVRGDAGQDPTEPRHSGVYPFPPVPDEPAIADLRARLTRAGVTPSALPLGLDLDGWLRRAATPWDAFPDTTGAKSDAESVGIAAALAHPNVTLETGALVTRLTAGPDGRIAAVEYRQGGEAKRLEPGLVALSAGAVNSAALLLRSGLANRSDQVGRNFMNHNCSAVLAVSPFRRNGSVYQKTLYVNDFYLSGGKDGTPLGNIQLLGKISGPILAAAGGVPRAVAGWLAGHAVDLYAMSEDLPDPESRVTLLGTGAGERIVLDWRRSNWEAHEALVARLKAVLRRAGFPVALSKPFDRRTPSHQCGTARMGRDPGASVLDVFCRAHDHANLFVVDASFLPTSAAVNPALTIAAQALRTADHMLSKDLAG
ncbi:FAD-dependent oxidoreductase [Amaricoccus sp.]|uniref:FAD-dependent oxidoreductase n=1 Tax=Amaricoccus sp. TaxID=1872485 RepID=UPI001B68B2A3|nr:GMC family oxidoreductase [Amaricoccus sp.]MBP7003288.1 GMC family oxidoreductase [Amaricoccus sp.]